MRIAYVSPCYAPSIGGVETHVAHLAARAASAGHHVEVLTQEHDRHLPAVERIDGVLVRRFPILLPGHNYAMAPGLWAYLARHGAGYDVVHAHSYHALPALLAALTASRPLVFTPHYHGTGHSPIRSLLHVPYRRLGAAIFARAAQVICVSEAEASLVRSHFPICAQRVTVIPNGVEAAALRAAEPFADPHRTILSVGRLETYKNVDRTIKALVHLDESFVLRIIGGGPARPALEQLAATLGLQARVSFLGRVDDAVLRRWFRTAQVCVSMSAHEAFGITVLEAVAAGSGVVASDIPAYREAALSGSPGAVALAPLDVPPDGLADRIRAAAAWRQRNESLPDIPSWDAVAERTLSVYRAAATSPDSVL